MPTTTAAPTAPARRKRPSLPMDDVQSLSNDYCGICVGCGEIADGIEPDAEKYDCASCGEPRVYGIEQAVLRGLITVTD